MIEIDEKRFVVETPREVVKRHTGLSGEFLEERDQAIVSWLAAESAGSFFANTIKKNTAEYLCRKVESA